MNLLWKSERSKSWEYISLIVDSVKDSKWTHVDKLLAILLLSAPSLVLENDIVIPSSLHAEILRVKQRVAPGNIDYPLLFLLRGPLLFLR